MLFENASHEIALLLFTLLVPIGLTALAVIACIRGFFATNEEADGRKLGKMTSIPAIIMIIGLICSFFHLGHLGTVFFMVFGIGSSPLTNEIIVAGISILVGVVYWILCLMKEPDAKMHKVCGIILCILALLTAIFTGVAYSIPTIITWDTPLNFIGQICLALLGGTVLAAFTLAIAGYEVEMQVGRVMKICAGVGLLGVAIVLFAQSVLSATALSSVGMLAASVMNDYMCVGIACIILCAVGYVLWLCSKDKVLLLGIGCLCVLIGLALMRIDFYGVFLSVGLTYL